jgi:ATP-dependent protease HslVU (ClpYQ) peptidase subunit
MTLAFAFKYKDEIWAATDRRIWLDNSYILADKHILDEENQRLILSSGTAISAQYIGELIGDNIRYDIEGHYFITSLIDLYKTEYTDKIMQDSDFNGLIIDKHGIHLIDGRLGCFNVGDYWAIGLQHDAAKALILSIIKIPDKLNIKQFCENVFYILNKIDYMIPCSYNVGENQIDIFCFNNGEWNKL